MESVRDGCRDDSILVSRYPVGLAREPQASRCAIDYDFLLARVICIWPRPLVFRCESLTASTGLGLSILDCSGARISAVIS